MRGPRTAMKSGPRLPQLEKALAWKRRPNIAKKKKKKKNNSLSRSKASALYGAQSRNTYRALVFFRWVNAHFHLFPIQYAESRFISDSEKNMFSFGLLWMSEARYFSPVPVVESEQGLGWASEHG